MATKTKIKLTIIDVLVVVAFIIFLFFIIFFLLGLRQTKIATYILGLAGLALSYFNFYVILVRPRYLRKPKLNFKPNVQYSPPPGEQNSGTKGSWFLRLKIVNKGLTPAKKCVGRLIEVKNNKNNKYKRFDRFDPFYLYWTRQDKLKHYCPIDIQGNDDFYFLDVAQVKEEDKNNNPINLRIVMPGGSLLIDSNVGKDEKLPPGIYHLLIAVYSEEDTFIEPTWFTISCPPDFSTQNRPDIVKALKADTDELRCERPETYN